MSLENKSIDLKKFEKFLKTVPVKTFLGKTTLEKNSKGYGWEPSENNQKQYFVNLKKGTNSSNFPKEFEGIKINYYEVLKSSLL